MKFRQLCDAVSDARRELGLSRKEVADLAGIDRESVDALYSDACLPEADLEAIQRWVRWVEDSQPYDLKLSRVDVTVGRDADRDAYEGTPSHTIWVQGRDSDEDLYNIPLTREDCRALVEHLTKLAGEHHA